MSLGWDGSRWGLVGEGQTAGQRGSGGLPRAVWAVGTVGCQASHTEHTSSAALRCFEASQSPPGRGPLCQVASEPRCAACAALCSGRRSCLRACVRLVCRLVRGNSIEEKLLKNGTRDLIREVAAQGSDYSMAFLTQVPSCTGTGGCGLRAFQRGVI